VGDDKVSLKDDDKMIMTLFRRYSWLWRNTNDNESIAEINVNKQLVGMMMEFNT
jgi:hypothetical protein